MNHKSTLAAVFGGALLAGSLLAPTAQAATPLTPDGWAAAIIGPTGKTTGRQLVMVSPTGAQYTVRSVGASWHVLQLSKDGRKVLLIGVTPDDQYRYAVVDRTRNTWTSVGVGPDQVAVDKLSSAAVIVWPEDGTVARRKVGTKVLTTYRMNTTGTWQQSPDGWKVVAETGKKFVVFNTTTGAKLRTLWLPSTNYSSCDMGHWDSNTTFTATCFPKTLPGPTVVFRYSTAGGSPVRLTNSTLVKSASPKILLDSWSTAKGQVVMGAIGYTEDPGVFGRVANSKVTWLAPATKCAAPIDVVGTSLYQLTGPYCQGTSKALSRHDLATAKTTVLAGGTRNPGQELDSFAIQNAQEAW